MYRALASLAIALAPLGCGGSTSGNQPACNQPRELPQEIHAPLALVAACSPYHASTPVTAYDEVTVAGGVTVLFDVGTSFAVAENDTGAGRLVVNGSASAPVVFAGAPGAAVGSWDFLDIDGSGASELHYLEVDGAGGAHSNGNLAAVSLEATTPILVDHLRVVGSALVGLRVYGPLAQGSSGIFVDGSAQEPIWAQSSEMGTLPAATLGSTNAIATIHVQANDVTASATWVSQPIPLHVDAPLLVYQGPNDTPTVLTIAPNTLLFDPGADMSVGGEISTSQSHANLVANGVTFDAVDPTQGWGGLRFIGRFDASSSVSGTVAHGSGSGLDDIPNMVSVIPGINIEKDATANDYPTLHDLTVRDTVVPPPPSNGNPNVGTCIGTSGPQDQPPPDWTAAQMNNTFTNCGRSADFFYPQ